MEYLDATMPRDKTKYYICVRDVQIEVDEKTLLTDTIFQKAHETIEGIFNETCFMWDGQKYKFQLDDIQSEYGKVFVKFSTIIGNNAIQKLLTNRGMMFEVQLLQSKSKLWCYVGSLKQEGYGRIRANFVGELEDFV